MTTIEPIRKKEQLHALEQYFLDNGKFRDYTMLVLGVHTPLRIDELSQLKWSDVYDEHRNIFLDRFTVTEQKTGRQKIIVLNPDIKEALEIYLPHRKSEWIFVSQNGEGRPIRRR